MCVCVCVCGSKTKVTSLKGARSLHPTILQHNPIPISDAYLNTTDRKATGAGGRAAKIALSMRLMTFGTVSPCLSVLSMAFEPYMRVEPACLLETPCRCGGDTVPGNHRLYSLLCCSSFGKAHPCGPRKAVGRATPPASQLSGPATVTSDTR